VSDLPSKKHDPKGKDNILDMRPKRTMKWKRGEKVSIVVPKARSLLGRHFIDALGLRPTYKINLDEFGSAVWNLCDGTRTVTEIGDELRTRFGKKVDPLYERLAVFIGALKREGLIAFV
jgi:hypothetical protein